MTYVCALCLSIFLAEWSKRETLRVRKIMWAIASSIPLFAVSALRYNIGTDYHVTYLKSYFLNETKFYFEPAFDAIYYILKRLNAHYQWIFIVPALFIAVLVFLSIYQQSPNPSLSIFLYVTSTYYFIGLNTVRQFVAMSICLYAMTYLTKKNGWWKYLVLVGVAALFHTSAWVMLLMLVLNLIPIKRVTLLLGGIFTVLGYFFVHYFKPVLSKIPRFGSYFGSVFDEKSFEYIYFGVSLAVFIFALLFYKESHENTHYSIHLKSVMISLIILFYSAEIPLTKRVAWYFALSQIILIPIVLQSVPKNMQRLWRTCIVTGYALMCFIGIGLFNKNECMPYQIFWGHSNAEVRMECEIKYGKKISRGGGMIGMYFDKM